MHELVYYVDDMNNPVRRGFYLNLICLTNLNFSSLWHVIGQLINIICITRCIKILYVVTLEREYDDGE